MIYLDKESSAKKLAGILALYSIGVPVRSIASICGCGKSFIYMSVRKYYLVRHLDVYGNRLHGRRYRYRKKSLS